MKLPRPFDLALVARSHGWYDLPPFSFDAERPALGFAFEEGGRTVTVTVSGRARPRVSASGGGVDGAVEAAVRRVLDLDARLEPFHALCREAAADGFGWIAERGAGRILRAPTLFEDAVKVLCTTNCSWALTLAMVTNLVACCGSKGAFPAPGAVAALPESRLRDDVRMGYRAPYLAAFASRVSGGALDLSRWEDPERPDEDVEREIRAEAGFGPYAADTLGRLLGRHAKLGLDAWSRKKVAALRFDGRAVSDRKVASVYARFGRFAGLAFWLDVTRDWHEGAERLWP